MGGKRPDPTFISILLRKDTGIVSPPGPNDIHMKKGCEPKGKWQNPINQEETLGIKQVLLAGWSSGVKFLLDYWSVVFFFPISTSRLRQPSPEVFWESLQKVSSDLKCKHMPYLPFPSPFFQQMRIKMLSEGHWQGLVLAKLQTMYLRLFVMGLTT